MNMPARQQSALRIPFSATPAVHAAIAGIGRTEDVAFSPDQTRLAIAGFQNNRLLILGLRRDQGGAVPAIVCDWHQLIDSDELRQPHGLAWLGNDALVVANRGGCVAIFDVPASAGSLPIRAEPALLLDDPSIGTPGSVAAIQVSATGFEILVCNNYRHTVTSHVIAKDPAWRVVENRTLIESGLDVPDGVSVSRDGRFVAISNHNKFRVDVFERSALAAGRSGPVLRLPIASYPHGSRFARMGSALFVADSAQPFVHLYAFGAGSRSGWRKPAIALQVLSHEQYLQGHKSHAEGGPKGLDLSDDETVLVCTCETEPLSFFDVRPPLDQLRDGASQSPPHRPSLVERTIDVLPTERLRTMFRTSAFRSLYRSFSMRRQRRANAPADPTGAR